MFPRIVFIIFAMNFIFPGKGGEPELTREDVDKIVGCYMLSLEVGKALLKGVDESHQTIDDVIRSTCLFFKEYGSCMEAVVKKKTPPVPKMMSFFVALQYQGDVVFKKAGLCPDVEYDGLKKIALQSGILEKEKLANMEDDDNVVCVGDAVKKCLIENRGFFKRKEGVGKEGSAIECLEEEAKTCTVPMLQHAIDLFKVYHKYVIKWIKNVMELEPIKRKAN